MKIRMKPQEPIRIAGLLMAVFAIIACNASAGQGGQTSPTIPAAAVPSAGGIPFFASPIRLVIPDGLASAASTEIIDVVTDQTGSAWDVAPAHLQLTLHGYALQSSFQVPQIFVYSAPDYAAANPSAAESIKRLQAVLSKPDAEYANDVLPRIPFLNAGQVFASQAKVLQFSGGSGLRIVTQYASDVSPINNGGLFYHFEGLSTDGKVYIVAILPTTLPFLAADNNPASPLPAGGIPFPQNNAPGSSFDAYFKQITDRINASPPGTFMPPLDSLDALIQSISTP